MPTALGRPCKHMAGTRPQPTDETSRKTPIVMSASQYAASPMAMAMAMASASPIVMSAMAMGMSAKSFLGPRPKPPANGQEGRSQPGWAPHQAHHRRPRIPPLQLPEEEQRPLLPPLQLREEEMEVEVEVELHMCHTRAPIGSQPRQAHHGWR